MTLSEYLLNVLDVWENSAANTLLTSLDPAVRQAAESRMCYFHELVYKIKRFVGDPDEERYAIDLAVERLRKASAKATQPHVRDQIRLACRQLNAVRQPAPADAEPIDIFDI